MKTKRTVWSLSLLLFFLPVSITCDQVPIPGSGRDAANFIPMRERVKIMQKFWDWKKENVLPMIMREQGVDMWIIRNDEEPLYRNTSYREHPVFTSLLPANHEGMVYSSQYRDSRSGIPEFLIFYDTGMEIEYVEPKDFAHITELVKERNPKKIAISMKNLAIQRQNIGKTSQYSMVTSDEMTKSLGSKYASRSVDSWELGILWLSILGPEQISLYRYVQGVHNDILAEAFSNKVVTPDVTTTDDINWWLRHKYLDLHLEIDNHPSISVTRRPSKIAEYGNDPDNFRHGKTRNGVNVIVRRGDLINCDSDIMLLGVETDSKQHAYVLQKGEEDVPESLKEALRIVNDIQDEIRNEFIVGRTAQEIREASDRIPRNPLITGTSSGDNLVEIDMEDYGFHPPPMFIRRFTENGLLFSRGTYVTGIGIGYKEHPLLSPALKLHYNMIFAFEPDTRIEVDGWDEDGLEIGVNQLAIFTENGLEYLDRPMLEWLVVE